MWWCTWPATVGRPGVYRLPAGLSGHRRGQAGRRLRSRGESGRDQPRGPPQRRSAGGRPGPRPRPPPRRRAGRRGPISLGSATVEQLDQVEGIGPGDGAEDHRVPRPAGRPLLDRPAGRGGRDRAGHHGDAQVRPAALSPELSGRAAVPTRGGAARAARARLLVAARDAARVALGGVHLGTRRRRGALPYPSVLGAVNVPAPCLFAVRGHRSSFGRSSRSLPRTT